MVLIYLSCAWVLGVFIGSRFAPAPAIVFTGLIPLLLLFFFRRQRKTIGLVSLCLLALFGGALHFQSSLPTADSKNLLFYNGTGTVEIRGTVDSDPEAGDKNTRLRLAAREIKLGDRWQEVSGTALLFATRYPEYQYGDILLVSGKLEAPAILDGFDYRDYLAHQGIYSAMFYPRIELLGTGGGSRPLELVYALRNRLSQVMTKILPEPQASLAQGILLGIRRNIPAPVNDAFSRSGTAHLLAISGLHIGILAGILLALGTFLFGRRHHIYIWLTLAIIWLYAIMTAMQPPVVRAAIMVSMFLAAELLGRQRSALTSLTFAAAVMVGISPQILWLASFQLSFLAMAGLILIAPPLMALGIRAIESTLGKDGAAPSIARLATDSFGVSLAAVLAVWPIVACNFGIVSFAGPLATFLALPALPGVIVTTGLASGIGLVALAPGYVLGWLAWLFLSYVLAIASGFAALPLSFVEVDTTNPALLWAYYSILAIIIWLAGNTRRLANFRARLNSATGKIDSSVSRLPLKWVLPPLLAVAVLLVAAIAVMPDGKLHVSFLDVGEGDAILVQQGNQQVLIDGGPGPQALFLELSDRMPFWDRTIEMVVLTHPHADHLAGLVEVLKRYKVERVLSPGMDSDSPLYREWSRLITPGGIQQTTAQSGMRVDLGDGVTIDVLNPQATPLTDSESDIDNNSVVLRLSTGKVSFLLTADIGWETEYELISRRNKLRSTVLKVAHHGSDTSTTAEFLARVDPEVAVISVGEGNEYSHPSVDVLDRLEKKVGTEKVYRTDRDGTIEFTTDGERLWVETKL